MSGEKATLRTAPWCPFERLQRLARGGVPDADEAVVGSRGDHASVVGIVDGVDEAAVAAHDGSGAGGDVDHSCVAVPTAENDAPAVGAVGDGLDRPVGRNRFDALEAEMPEPAPLPVAELAFAAIGQETLGFAEGVVSNLGGRQADLGHVGLYFRRAFGDQGSVALPIAVLLWRPATAWAPRPSSWGRVFVASCLLFGIGLFGDIPRERTNRDRLRLSRHPGWPMPSWSRATSARWAA